MTSLLQQRFSSSNAKDSGSDSELHEAAPRSRDVNAQGAQFMDLPTEIHILISKNLIYPDALSLKHTSRYFYNLVDTGVRLKVAWLMERRLLHLDCPNDRGCILKTDREFCRGSVTSVLTPLTLSSFRPFCLSNPFHRLLMQRRREHVECESRPGLGCLVYDTPQCALRRDWRKRWSRRMRQQVTIELWWILLAAIPLFLGWFWMAEFASWVMT